jgi:hypothetical protein
MACPRLQDFPGACEYDNKKNTCKTPNPWIQHLIRYGKQGLNMRQIKSKYVSRRAEESTCTLVRKNMKDRPLDLSDNPREFLLTLHNQRRLRPTTIINRILYELEHKHKFPIDAADGNWLTNDKLEKAFDVIDHHLAGGSLGRYFKNPGKNRGLLFKVQTNPSIREAAWCLAFPATEKRFSEAYFIFFERSKWGKEYQVMQHDFDEKNRIKHTLRFRNLLDAFIGALLHEIGHLINYIDLKNSDNHGPNWRKISENFWGFAGEYVRSQSDTIDILID